MVRIKKYRVTIEEIEEPIEVLQDRVKRMWAENQNLHSYAHLEKAAKKLGLTREDLEAAKREKR